MKIVRVRCFVRSERLSLICETENYAWVARRERKEGEREREKKNEIKMDRNLSVHSWMNKANKLACHGTGKCMKAKRAKREKQQRQHRQQIKQ